MRSKIMDQNEVEKIRTAYPAGTRVELVIPMDDPFSKIPSGAQGSVEMVDDVGTIHMAWDCGSKLGLIPFEDLFKKI